MALDLTLLPLYRTNGQEAASMPGLLVTSPPRKTARGREQDRLVVYLLLTGNATISSAEYSKIAADAANVFYQSSGSLTSALRATSDSVNRTVLDRNLSTSGRGQYVNGWLTLAALRDSHCTILLSGPVHVYFLAQAGTRHIFEPVLAGKGLGLNQTATVHYSQAELQAGDRILLCGRVPSAWESALNDAAPASLSATPRRLVTLTGEDLNAVLFHATEGTGRLTLLLGGTEPNEEPVSEPAPHPAGTVDLPRVEETESPPEEDPVPFQAHMVQPSAYAIPPQRAEAELPESDPVLSSAPVSNPVSARNPAPRDFPASIPRAQPQVRMPEPPAEEKVPPILKEEIPARFGRKAVSHSDAETPLHMGVETKQPEATREPSERTRQAARVLAGSIRSLRHANERMGEGLKKFLPRLLPATETGDSPVFSSSVMFLIAILAPLIVVTIASVMYLRFGRSIQYETYINQAREVSAQARNLTGDMERREAWKQVLLNVAQAEEVRKTPETEQLRAEAQGQLDVLLGYLRLQFLPAFSTNPRIEISRMAASETDLFLLNAENGAVVRAEFSSGRGFQIDSNFSCAPGVYGGYTVGPLVDVLAMPILNSINATVLAIDAGGNLLYCAPNQVAQAIPLPPPDTNWGRVTAFVLDAGNLYVLDAPSRAVWVYTGKDGTFIDRPYFFFGGQTPEKQDVIDLLVVGDELYMLHADGHLSNCSYSRIETAPTHCEDPATLTNPFPAYQDTDLFGTAHITQIAVSAAPDTSLLLLSADDQAVFRITPRSFELQNQMKPTSDASNPVPAGPVDAMAVGPNHVLYLAVDGQVYFATGMP